MAAARSQIPASGQYKTKIATANWPPQSQQHPQTPSQILSPASRRGLVAGAGGVAWRVQAENLTSIPSGQWNSPNVGRAGESNTTQQQVVPAEICLSPLRSPKYIKSAASGRQSNQVARTPELILHPPRVPKLVTEAATPSPTVQPRSSSIGQPSANGDDMGDRLSTQQQTVQAMTPPVKFSGDSWRTPTVNCLGDFPQLGVKSFTPNSQPQQQNGADLNNVTTKLTPRLPRGISKIPHQVGDRSAQHLYQRNTQQSADSNRYKSAAASRGPAESHTDGVTESGDEWDRRKFLTFSKDQAASHFKSLKEELEGQLSAGQSNGLNGHQYLHQQQVASPVNQQYQHNESNIQNNNNYYCGKNVPSTYTKIPIERQQVVDRRPHPSQTVTSNVNEYPYQENIYENGHWPTAAPVSSQDTSNNRPHQPICEAFIMTGQSMMKLSCNESDNYSSGDRLKRSKQSHQLEDEIRANNMLSCDKGVESIQPNNQPLKLESVPNGVNNQIMESANRLNGTRRISSPRNHVIEQHSSAKVKILDAEAGGNLDNQLDAKVTTRRPVAEDSRATDNHCARLESEDSRAFNGSLHDLPQQQQQQRMQNEIKCTTDTGTAERTEPAIAACMQMSGPSCMQSSYRTAGNLQAETQATKAVAATRLASDERAKEEAATPSSDSVGEALETSDCARGSGHLGVTARTPIAARNTGVPNISTEEALDRTLGTTQTAAPLPAAPEDSQQVCSNHMPRAAANCRATESENSGTCDIMTASCSSGLKPETEPREDHKASKSIQVPSNGESQTNGSAIQSHVSGAANGLAGDKENITNLVASYNEDKRQPNKTEDNQVSQCNNMPSAGNINTSDIAPDRDSARRLAKRLYNLSGFKRSDVCHHLAKCNPFSRMVADEYLNLFDFRSMKLDAALRKFLSKLQLTGETQERERMLSIFSQRYYDCNQDKFPSSDIVQTLVCALILLNTDLHGGHDSKRRKNKLSLSAFVDGLNSSVAAMSRSADQLDARPVGKSTGNSLYGYTFPNHLLVDMYESIKKRPLKCGADDKLCDMSSFEAELDKIYSQQAGGRSSTLPSRRFAPGSHGSSSTLSSSTRRRFARGFSIGASKSSCHPQETEATIEFRSGYLNRKKVLEPRGKPTPKGRRGWRRFHVIVRDLRLIMRLGIHELPPPTPEEPNQVGDQLRTSSGSVDASQDENGQPVKAIEDKAKPTPIPMSPSKTRTTVSDIKNSVKIHHTFAYPSTSYAKREFVFHLRLADRSEYLLQAASEQEMKSWVDTINFASACLSSPALPSAVSSPRSKAANRSSQRALLPSAYTRLSYWEQLIDHEERLQRLKVELDDHLAEAPNTRNANQRDKTEFIDRIAYLKQEIERYSVYVELMRKKSNSPEAIILSKHPQISSLVPSEEMIRSLPSFAPVNSLASSQSQSQSAGNIAVRGAYMEGAPIDSSMA